MINYQTALTATAIVVIAGRWANKKSLDPTLAIGGMVLYLFIAMMPEPLNDDFATLVLATALMAYAVPLFGKMYPTK